MSLYEYEVYRGGELVLTVAARNDDAAIQRVEDEGYSVECLVGADRIEVA